MGTAGGFGAAGEVVVEGEGVVFAEEEEEGEEEAVKELLAGDLPLLIGGDADREGHHEEGAGDEGGAGGEADDEGEAEGGFEEGDAVGEGEDEARWRGAVARCAAVVWAKAPTPE